MSDRTANRFMDVGRLFGSKSATVADLPPTALYELAAPKAPLEIREEVETPKQYSNYNPTVTVGIIHVISNLQLVTSHAILVAIRFNCEVNCNEDLSMDTTGARKRDCKRPYEVIIRDPSKAEFRAMRRSICLRMVKALIQTGVDLSSSAEAMACLRSGPFQHEAIERIGPIAIRVAKRTGEGVARAAS